ncbi:MAG: type II toxin-antitoxin system ParD family antitoxin [Maioricimonas sp. JB045]|uniref:type II toxin-antitoxin system ParD family antitoxin n=1 Tax=Maioricimonas sp. JC845 TaxID=3232138 RepID=UPI00345AB2A8
MPNPIPSDVQKSIDAQLASGRYSTSGEVLRAALRALEEEEEDLVAVRAAVDEWRAGDEGKPLAEVFDQIRNNDKPNGTSE